MVRDLDGMDYHDWGPGRESHADSPAVCPQWIRVGRESRGMTIRDLAAMIGRSPAFLSAMERGEKPTGADDLARLSEALDYPSNFFGQSAPWPVLAWRD